MYGYFTDETASTFDAKDTALYRRIQQAGTWTFTPMTLMDKRGIFFFKGDLNDVDELKLSPCEGGYFYNSGKLPRIGELAKKTVQEFCNIVLKCGETISVPMATFASYAVDFSDGTLPQVSDPYARQAIKIDEKLRTDEQVTYGDLISLAFYAVSETYEVTAELLTALNIIDSADVFSIYSAVWGIDPKSSSAAEDT